MSESAQRTEIKNIMDTVTDIGKVYDYERWAANWNDFINLFKSVAHSQIRGWEISRKAAGIKKAAIGTSIGSYLKDNDFVIKGYMAIDDSAATEKTFNTLIEAVEAKFRSNMTLNGAAKDHDYIQVRVIDSRMFGSVLCHYAELYLKVYERV